MVLVGGKHRRDKMTVPEFVLFYTLVSALMVAIGGLK